MSCTFPNISPFNPFAWGASEWSLGPAPYSMWLRQTLLEYRIGFAISLHSTCGLPSSSLERQQLPHLDALSDPPAAHLLWFI